MRSRKPLSFSRKLLSLPFPRRIPKLIALAIATVCIGASALLGLRATQSQYLQNDDVVDVPANLVVDLLPAPVSLASPYLEKRHIAGDDGRVANYETRSDIVPENAPGELAVRIPFTDFGNRTKEAEAVFKAEAFNLMASDIISMQRRIPDYRGTRCLVQKYDLSLPSASVVIVFYNEPFSSLLRTVWSVINRSRPEYLREIIMVDDASERAELKSKLEDYVRLNFGTKVRILRAPVHKGLIQGKLAGARNATADVLVFLDSHCEVNVGWLEPLLTRIKENRKLVACPLVDTIKAEDLGYTPSANWATGLFTWSLYYKWGPEDMTAAEKKRVKDVESEPHRTPTFPGGLFAMDRNWFFEVGAYDEQMEGWGGENLEMSFRVWMCGGALEFIPCSRVGHISRLHTYNGADEDRNHAINSARLAEVWMDDYKRLFYQTRPKMMGADIGAISSRKALRETLKCHSFKWYLENLFAEKFIPDEQSKHYGQLYNIGTKYCLHTINADEHGPSGFTTLPCITDVTNRQYLLQLFALSKDDELRREEWCLDAGTTIVPLQLQSYVCNPESYRTWKYNSKSQLRNKNSGQCLEAKPGREVGLMPCVTGEVTQKWAFYPLLKLDNHKEHPREIMFT